MDEAAIDRLQLKVAKATFELNEWAYPPKIKTDEDKMSYVLHRIYKQPPSGHLLEYPCIILEFSNVYNRNADDRRYLQYDKYLLTVVTKSLYAADSFRKALLEMPFATFDRSFVSDNLYHDTIYIYTK